MSEIKYIEKPDWISWDEIHDCIYKSHEVNRKKGLNMTSQNMTGLQLKEKLKNGYCFVALKNNIVIGTVSLLFINSKHWWWTRKTVAYTLLDAILPEYRGTDVFFGLEKIRNKYINDSGVRIRQCNTAEQNKTVIKLCKRAGYKIVQYSATAKGATHYSVIMALWEDGCPWPDWLVNFMFKLSKFTIRAIWKPGYKLRWL